MSCWMSPVIRAAPRAEDAMLKITTKSRYALHALIELASNYGDEPTYLGRLAEAAGTSQKYLERIFARLKEAGIIESFRGKKGGYILARPPAEIRLIDIWRALEGDVLPLECLAEPDSCPKSDRCVPQKFWARIAEAVSDVLKSTTLEELAMQQGANDGILR